MSAPALTQFLVDVTRGRLVDDFSSRPSEVIASAKLPDSIKQALRDHDLLALWHAGAHPMALLYFNRARGLDNDHYYRSISNEPSPVDID